MYKIRFYRLGFAVLAALAMAIPIWTWAGGDMPRAYWTDPITDTNLNTSLNMGDSSRILRLNAEVPAGKMLKAWKISLKYDAAKISVENVTAPAESPFKQINMNKGEGGIITTNAFDVKGVKGPASIPFLDVKVKTVIAGTSDLVVSFDKYGASKQDEFRPDKLSLNLQKY
ncbi:hypothetical protein ACFL5W_01115 [Thermodesulfobacteriota bacterium]